MKRYCVKCSRILPVSFFYISQGSAASHLRCGGQRAVSFVANFEYIGEIIVKIGQHLSKL